MERTGLVLVLAVGILSTLAYGYQLPRIVSEILDETSNVLGKQKQNDSPLNIPDNAFPVEYSHISFPCRQDGLFAYPQDCTLGVSCSGGISQLFTCTDVLHFNNVTKKCEGFCSAHCDPILACPCGWDSCKTLKSIRQESVTDEVALNNVETLFSCITDGLYPDPLDCNQFIHCSNDRVFFMKCPSGLHFNRETERCEKPEDAACVQSIQMSPREDDETGDLEKEPRNPFICRHDGMFPIPGRCNHYYKCRGDFLVFGACPTGLHYNKKTKICEIPCKARCDPRLSPCSRRRLERLSTAIPVFTSSESSEIPVVEHVTSSEHSKPFSKLKVAFVCPDDGLYPNAKNCSKYINCSNGNAYELSCPPSRHFNSETKQCETFCSAKCAANLVCDWRDTMRLYEELWIDVCNITDENYFVTGLYYYQCGVYYRCEGGELNKFRCPDGQHFSQETERCEEPCDARCDKSLADRCGFEVSTEWIMERMERTCIKGKKNFEMRSSYQCKFHFKCEGGEVSVVHCPNGQHTNYKTYRCEEPCEARCDRNFAELCGWRINTTESETAPTQMAPREYNEDDKFDEDDPRIAYTCHHGALYPDHERCNIFYECSYGKILMHICFPGYHYNRRTKRCDSPCKAKCDPHISCIQKTTKSVTAETPVTEDFTYFVSTESSNKVFKLKVRFVCFDDGLFAHQRNCSKYINCTNGNAYELSCPASKHFNNVTKQCETFCSAKCDPNLICNWRDSMTKFEEGWEMICNNRDENVLLPSLIRCDIYYKCEDFELYKFHCPNGQHFHLERNRCEEPCDAHCDASLAEQCGWVSTTESGTALPDTLTTHESDATLTPPKYSKQLCSEDGTYLERNPLDCNTYFKCMDGDADLLYCPDGQHFNQQTLQCEEACDAQCDSTMGEKCGWTYTTESNQIFSNSLKQPVFDFECPRDGLYANIACENFIQCASGQAYLIDCPYGLHYEPYSRRCISPCEARCDSYYEYYCTDEQKQRAPKQLLGDFDCVKDGYHVNPVDCASFIQCFHGHAYAIYCPAGLHYSPTQEICMSRCDAKCAPNYEDYCGAEEWDKKRKLQDNRSNSAKQPFPLVSEFFCENDGDYPNPENCNSYITCISGESSYKYCPEELHFSEKTLTCESPCEARCEPSLACDCDWDTCEELQEAKFYAEIDCEVELDEGPCRGRFPRYAYDASRGRCRGFFYGGCGGNSNNFRTMEECEHKCQDKLLRGYRCPADTGMFGNYPDCVSYYHCKRGKPTLKRCPRGKAFDHKKAKCVREYEATCVYECRDRDAVYPYEEDCRKYIDCVNGISKLETCPTGKAFDPEKKDCIPETRVETCFLD